MIHKQFYLRNKDKLKLFAQYWAPDSNQKAVVILVHGLGEHSSRYSDLADDLVKSGYVLFAFDQRGHGKSSGRRGYAKCDKVLLKDIDFIINEAKKHFKKTPRILLGHSMGGNLVLSYIISKRSSKLKGVVSSSPWIKLQQGPSPLVKGLAKFVLFIFARFRTKTGLNPEDMTHDKPILQKTYEDEYMHNKIGVRLYFSIEESGEAILKNKHKINIPLLIMHGNKDKVTSVQATKKLAKNTSKLTHLKIWDNDYHELFNEVNREEVISYMIDWLNELKL